MQITVQKWGNSLALRVPNFLTKKFDLHAGSIVEIQLEEDHISIYPKRYKLSDLLARITAENVHTAQMDDEAKGNEEW